MDEVRSKHLEMELLIRNINSKTVGFNNTVFFKEVTLGLSFTSFEIFFKEYIFWLYALFQEAPGLNLKFIEGKIRDFKVPLEPGSANVLKLVHAFRTIRGHLTDRAVSDDADKLNFCGDWYKTITGKLQPNSEDEWKKCAYAMLDDSIAYLKAVELCVDQCIADEFSDIIMEDWDRVINRSYSKHDWEVVLIEVLETHGMPDYDTLVIVGKQLAKWRGKLKLLRDGFVFKTEAWKIIESYICEEDLWPATANDLIAMGVPKGPGLTEMVKKAKALYYSAPCGKEELLKRFKVKYL